MNDNYEVNEETNVAMEEPVEEIGFMGRLTGIIVNPSKVFNYLAQKPKVLEPILVITCIFVVSMLGIFVPYREVIREQLILTYEQMNYEITEKMLNITVNSTVIFSAVMLPIITLLSTLLSTVYYLVLNILLKGKAKFKQLFSVILYSNIVGVIGSVVGLVLVAITGDQMMQLATSVASFLGDNTIGFLGGFLAPFEIFTIWSTVLIYIGFQRVSKLSKQKALIVVAVGFLLAALCMGAYQQINASMLENMNMNMYQ